jgi:hypothetical protein
MPTFQETLQWVAEKIRLRIPKPDTASIPTEIPLENQNRKRPPGKKI